jgi:MFS family permease
MPDTHRNLFHFLNRELSEMYMTVAIRAFAISLISVFIPIYLLQEGFSLRYVFLFYSILCFVHALFSHIATKLSTKIGVKHSILISMPFLIGFYILLQFVGNSWVFYITPIIGGIQGALFWVNFHMDFAVFSTKKIRAKQISGYAVVCLILSALGPLLGGFLLLYFNFNVLFIIVSFLLLFSTIPLFASGESYVHADYSFKKVGEVIKKLGWKGLTGFVGYGMILCSAVFLPVLLFFTLKTYLNVGAIVSLTLFFGIISTFFVGRLADRFGNGKVLRIGSLFTFVGWSLIAFFQTVLSVIGLNLFLGLTAPTSGGGPAFDALNYDIAKRKHIAEVITLRETTIRLSLGLILFILFFISNLRLAFLFGSLGSILIIIFSFLKKKV